MAWFQCYFFAVLRVVVLVDLKKVRFKTILIRVDMVIKQLVFTLVLIPVLEGFVVWFTLGCISAGFMNVVMCSDICSVYWSTLIIGPNQHFCAFLVSFKIDVTKQTTMFTLLPNWMPLVCWVDYMPSSVVYLMTPYPGLLPVNCKAVNVCMHMCPLSCVNVTCCLPMQLPPPTSGSCSQWFFFFF